MVGDELVAVVAPLIAAVDGGWPRGGLLLVGEARAGKTHLARAFAQARGGVVLPGRAVIACNDALWRSAHNAIAIDDADCVQDEEGLLQALDAAQAPDRRLLLTASTPPSGWRLKMRDLTSRVASLPRVRLPDPDEAMMAALLTRLCRQRFMKLDDNAGLYLARHLERTYGEAQRIVEVLDALVEHGGRPVSLAMASRALQLIRPSAPGLDGA